MRGHRLRTFLLGATLLGAFATAAASCFEVKQPPCAFSCATPPHTCPRDYTCGDDGLCYRDGADPAKCVLTPPGDAGTDAATDR